MKLSRFLKYLTISHVLLREILPIVEEIVIEKEKETQSLRSVQTLSPPASQKIFEEQVEKIDREADTRLKSMGYTKIEPLTGFDGVPVDANVLNDL
jgi:hypothetical protein